MTASTEPRFRERLRFEGNNILAKSCENEWVFTRHKTWRQMKKGKEKEKRKKKLSVLVFVNELLHLLKAKSLTSDRSYRSVHWSTHGYSACTKKKSTK